jgi:hypothetical protein
VTHIVDLLELHNWTVFDIDDEGRVLAGSDASGSMQLVEINAAGKHTELTKLPGRCSGRYLRGRRIVVVEHDADGNERSQLSLLDMDEPLATPAGLDDLVPLVHDPSYIHTLVDVGEDTVVYSTNRRNGVDFDVVVRNLNSGDERVLYDAGGFVSDVHVEGETVTVTLYSLQPASTQVRLVHDGVISDVTAADDHAWHTSARVLPGTETVLMSSNHGRDFRAVVRADAAGSWETVVASDDHDISVIPSPDGSRLLIIRHIDGGDRLAIHDSVGTWRTDVALPGDGVAAAVWAPNSAEWLILEYGTALAGLTLVPVNPSLQPAELAHIRLKANGDVTEESILEFKRQARSGPELSHDAWDRLEKLIAHYGREENGYLSRALPFRQNDTSGDYDHLARVLEWSAGADAPAGEGGET